MVDWDERMTASLIRWIALLPLAAALIHAALIGLVRAQIAPRTIWLLSSASLTVSFLLSATSIFDLVGAAPVPPIVDRVGPWLGGGVGARHFSADLSLRLDPLSAVCCLVVTGIALAVYLYVLGRIQNGALPGEVVHRLFALLDLLVGSTLVLLLADNLILFLFGWAGVGVASQLVSSFDYESKRAARAGATTFVVGRVGDLALLAAILLLFDGLARSGAPALSFERIEASFRLVERRQVELPLALGGGGFPLLELVAGLFVFAGMTKCAQVPLHFWLAGASRGPASATALIHSATTVVAGCYGLLRLSFLLEQTPVAASVLVAVGATTAVLASLAAATQLDLPRVVASATSASIGLVLVGIGLGAPSSATYLLLSHAFAKAQWLLVLGIVQSARKGETDLRAFGGLARSLRWTHAMAIVAGLAVVGAPPIGTFVAQEELLAWIEAEGSPVLFAASWIALTTLAYAVGRVHGFVFFGPVRETDESMPTPARTEQDPTGPIQLAIRVLAPLAVVVGWLSPSQFWGDLLGVPHSDTVGGFLAHTLPGPADPPGVGRLRLQTLFACAMSSLIGLGLAAVAARRAASRAPAADEGSLAEAERPGTSPLPAGGARALLRGAMRETFYLEQLIDRLVTRPLRGISRWLLAGFVEARILDRVVVSGGAGLARRFVWSGLRRLQNGRIQSYAMLGLVALLLSALWLAE